MFQILFVTVILKPNFMVEMIQLYEHKNSTVFFFTLLINLIRVLCFFSADLSVNNIEDDIFFSIIGPIMRLHLYN